MRRICDNLRYRAFSNFLDGSLLVTFRSERLPLLFLRLIGEKMLLGLGEKGEHGEMTSAGLRSLGFDLRG